MFKVETDGTVAVDGDLVISGDILTKLNATDADILRPQNIEDIKVMIENGQGKVIILPTGDFITESVIQLPNDITIIGNQCRLISGASGRAIFSNEGVSNNSNITINGVTFKGYSHASVIGSSPINDDSGIVLYKTHNVNIIKCSFEGFLSAGIDCYNYNGNVGKRNHNTLIQGCKFYQCWVGASIWYNHEYGVISGCQFRRCRIGCLLESGNTRLNDSNFSDCRCSLLCVTGHQVIPMYSTAGGNNTHCSITGCTFNHSEPSTLSNWNISAASGLGDVTGVLLNGFSADLSGQHITGCTFYFTTVKSAEVSAGNPNRFLGCFFDDNCVIDCEGDEFVSCSTQTALTSGLYYGTVDKSGANITRFSGSVNIGGSLICGSLTPDTSHDFRVKGGTVYSMDVSDSKYLKAGNMSSTGDVMEHVSLGSIRCIFDENNNSSSSEFLVGHNGSGNLVTRLLSVDNSGDCNIGAAASYNSSGSDFAEYFESSSGEAIPPGTCVTIDNAKVRRAKPGEVPIGVVRPIGTSTIIGNASAMEWHGKYLLDEYGGVRCRTVELVDDDGNIVKEVQKCTNPQYDPTREYIQRRDRPEWVIVALVGRARVTRGEVTGRTWIKLASISNTVDEYLIK